MRTLLLGLTLGLPGTALACGGKKAACVDCDDEKVAKAEEAHAAQAAAAVNPTHCAKRADLIGANCSYTTGMMAQRVLEEGRPYSYTGMLVSSSNQLHSRVAAPYGMGPDHAVHVVANEVLDQLARDGADAQRVSLSGKILEVDGVAYFVALEYQSANS